MEDHECQAREFVFGWGLANGLLNKGIDKVKVALS